MELCYWIIGLIAILLESSEAHVSLIFPPARKYNLDFLDSLR